MQIQATIENGMIFCEYNPRLILEFRNRGGRWDSNKRGWKFNEEQGGMIFDEFFGTGDVVTVLVPISKAETPERFCVIGGYVLASRQKKEYSVKLADGVLLAAGSFKAQGGSINHPDVDANDDVIFKLNVYRSFAEKHGLQIDEQQLKHASNEENDLLFNISDEILIAELSKRGYNVKKQELDTTND